MFDTLASLWQSWQKPSRNKRARRRAGRRRVIQPRLEMLEERLAPAIVMVTTLSDVPSHTGTSLRDAIAAANPGDQIQFQTGLSGAIDLSTFQSGQGGLTLSKNVTIDGTGASITIEGGSTAGSSTNAEPFIVNSGVTAVLNDLTISNGYGGSGGAISNSGTLTVNNCNVANNSAANAAGGIFSDGALTVSNSTLTGNYCSANDRGAYGGAIWSDLRLTVSNSTFSGNSASSSSSGGYYSQALGGGIYFDGGTLTVSNSTLSGNSVSASASNGANLATTGGAGIYTNTNGGVGTSTISNSTFSGNVPSASINGSEGSSYGGGVFNDGPLTVLNSTFATNSAGLGGLGGAIYDEGTLNLANNILANSVFSDGDLYVAGTVATAQNNLIQSEAGSIGPNLQNGSNGNIVGASPVLSALGYYGGPTQTFALLPGSPALDAGSNSAASGLSTDQRGLPRIANGTVDIGALESQPFVVNTTADSNTTPFGTLDLRQAVNLANVRPGSTITFDSNAFATPQTINLTGGLLTLSDTSGTTTIQGPGANLVTIDGNNATEVFQVGRDLADPGGPDSRVTAVLDSLTIAHGSSGGGGGIYNLGTLTVSNSNVSNNFAYSGGGIYNVGTLTVSNSTLSNNSTVYSGNGAVYGGAIYNDGTLTVSNSTLSNDSATNGRNKGGGGGIANFGTMTVSESTFSGDSANAGGAIYNGGGTLTVSNSTLASNSASLYGGGIFNSGTLTVSNSTLSGNSASNGGAIYNASTLTVSNSTFASNSASSSGGGIYNNNGTLNLSNTILANSTSGTDLYVSSGTVATAQNNLIGSQTGSPIQNGVNGNIVGQDPLLSALGYYGGPTETFALLPGSPALDAGSNAAASGLTTDQRGQPRITDGTVDIGAFESRGFNINLSGGGQSTPINTAFASPLAVTVSSIDGAPVAGGTISFTAPASGASATLSASSATLPASGQATITATADSTLGSYVVTVSAGSTYSATASLTNLKAVPTLTTSPGGTVVYGSGQLTDSATLSGGYNPTGTITFTLYAPNGTVVDTETASVNGNGTYSTPTGYAPSGVGTYQWFAQYSGDGNNHAVSPSVGTTASSTLTGLYDIYSVAIDKSGNRYVAESLPNRVAVFAPGSTSPTSFLTGVSLPTWLGFDPSGDLFVASAFTSGLWKFAPGSTTPTATLTGIDNPQGLLTFDAHGDLFISNAGNNTVSEFAPGSTSPTATLTGLNSPADLAFDRFGDLFVRNSSGNTVSEFAPGSTSPMATLTGLNDPQGLAFDAQGDLFVSDYGNNTVSEFAPGSTTPTATLTGSSGPTDLAFDSNGDLFVLDSAANTVSEFAPGSTTPTATLTGLDQTIHMAFDSQGNLYVVNYGNASVSEFTPVTNPEVVAKATPTITWSNPADIIYGTALGSTQLNATASVPGNFTYTVTASSASASGAVLHAGNNQSLTATFTPTDTTDYTTATMSVLINVAQAPLTITADSKHKNYGAPLPTLTASYNGFVNGDTAASLTTAPTLNTTATAASHVSGNQYSITASGAVDSDYTIGYVSGTLTVDPVALTITADNKSKVFGQANPALTTSYSGFVNGDTAASLTTAPTLSTTATTTSHVSGNPYPISASGAVDSDYTISYAAGTLTVTPDATTTAVSASVSSPVFGQAVSFTVTVTANAPGSGTPTRTVQFTIDGNSFGTPVALAGGSATSASTASLAVGAHVITASYSGVSDFSASQGTVAGAAIISTFAGNGTHGFNGDGIAATSAQLNVPFGVATDAAGNVYIADSSNNRIRKVSVSGAITTVAGTGGTGFSGDGGLATAALLNNPRGVAVDAAGNLYIADTFNNRIRKVSTSGIITTVAGNGTSGFSGDGSSATAAAIRLPTAVAVDASGNIYIADGANNRIRKVNTAGVITTLAGTGTAGFGGDNDLATSAQLNNPQGVAVDGAGNVFIADTFNNRIRKVDTSGGITTIAGGGFSFGISFTGAATSAVLADPWGVAVDSAGNVFIAELDYNDVRKVNTSGVISTFAGNGFRQSNGEGGYTGDGGTANAAELNGPVAVAADAAGNVFIADNGNSVIREVGSRFVVAPAATTTVVSSSGSPSIWSQSVTFTATVSVTAPGAGTPTGTVTFEDGATVLGSGGLQVVNGLDQATYTTSALEVGSHTITAIYNTDGNFTTSTSAGTSQIVNKATPTIAWANPADIVYGTALGSTQLNATASVPGSFTYTVTASNGPPSGVVLNAGNNQSLSVTFTPTDTTDYTTATASVVINVAPAPPMVSVTDAGGTYTGNPFPAIGSAVGVDGQTAVSGSFSYAYYLGSDTSGTSLGATAPINAGTYTVVATFISGDANYGTSTAQTTFTIIRATPTNVTVSDNGGIYNGRPYAATATIAGVDGKPVTSLDGVSLTLDYIVFYSTGGSQNLGAQAPTAAGSYSAGAYFTGSTNYFGTSQVNTYFTITPATPAVSVTDAGGTYNGSSFPATATINGGSTLEGVGLSLSYFSGTYTDPGQLAGLTSLGGPPTAAGTYTVLAAFAGSADYSAATALATFSIKPPPPPTAHLTSPTVSQSAGSTAVGFTLTASDPTPALQGGSFTYTVNWGDGTSQTVTATATSGPLTHAYTAANEYTVSVTVQDQGGAVSAPATASVVVSTAAGDQLTLEDPSLAAGRPAGAVWVTWNSTTTTYQPTDQVIVAGRGGTDVYRVDFGQLPVPVSVAAGGLTSGDKMVVNGVPNATTNRITKTAGAAQGQGTITWTDGSPTTVTEAITFASVPRVTINVNGTKTNYVRDPGNETTINGGPGANTIEITATSGDGVVLNGGASTNSYIIDLGSLAGPVAVQNSNAGATDSLIVNGAAGDNSITVAGNQVTEGAQTITDSAPLANLTINGGPGNNQLTFSGLTVPVQSATLVGGGGTNTYTLNGGTVNIVAGTGVNIVNVAGGTVASVTAPAGGTPAATATVLTVSAATPLFGVDTVTFTATVTATPGNFTDTVDFYDSTTHTDLTPTPVPVVNGVAVLSISTLAVGSHTITATASGDPNFQPSSGSASVTVISPASLSGTVFADFNDDGQIDFGENGISGVSVHLTGTDDLGHAVDSTFTSDGDGAYLFLNLRPGSYYLTKTTQPTGYTPGIDSLGTAGGSLSTTVADQFFVQLAQGVNGLNYNYGEQPTATGSVQNGQTAGIGFWNNKNGQALILALNGGGSSHQLGDWLAATFSHMYGADSANNLAGKNNAYVAGLFQQDFLLKGVKLDAQVLSTALSAYATNATLDSTQVAAHYGFTVNGYGLSTMTFSVGSNGDAFGVANNTTMTVMDLLLAADAQTVNGVLYNGNVTKRNEANNVFSALNQSGGIN